MTRLIGMVFSVDEAGFIESNRKGAKGAKPEYRSTLRSSRLCGSNCLIRIPATSHPVRFDRIESVEGVDAVLDGPAMAGADAGGGSHVRTALAQQWRSGHRVSPFVHLDSSIHEGPPSMAASRFILTSATSPAFAGS
ncbi:hypothetical protein [Imhoffiella purpurea]|uniref:hypothetical protein n=1 Tax=Imhoffiella purpurea TaxID=1249627 RepID=UPI0012FD8A9C|nr:hypothetical protein [Imhoffiella purpurea]